MALTEKATIYFNIWCCAYQRRYQAKLKNKWDLYDREHETILMCLKMKDAQWYQFDSEKPHYLK